MLTLNELRKMNLGKIRHLMQILEAKNIYTTVQGLHPTESDKYMKTVLQQAAREKLEQRGSKLV